MDDITFIILVVHSTENLKDDEDLEEKPDYGKFHYKST